MKKTVDVVIPVYKPGEEFKKLIQKLMKQTVQPEHIFILQTIEGDMAPMQSQDEKIKVYPIQKKEFDHGKTRDYGIRLSEADYVLLMTQDAIPADSHVIEQLLEGFQQEKAGIVYGRQLARKDADILEQMARLHNYPENSMLKTKADLERMGIQTYFNSDVCAMYDRNLYLALGGFSYPTIFNEDMIMASKFIQADYSVYYAADAKVIHSHSYNCRQQFVRSFDLGVSQKQYSEVFASISSEKEGAGFAKNTILTLCKKGRIFKAIYFAWQCGCRLVGYQLGLHYQKLSKKMILRCTMNPGYWEKED
ncbi:MAG: glycosyltransferase [Butyribacter sp.]|nr:glycosyltransferase [bacterium]MDY3854908.1 glycosyltransferase [Butyribacter sp.]